jgi:twitching motility protein PilT
MDAYPASAKVYMTAEGEKFSILDMLNYFLKYGPTRVSDLHLKIGAQPGYRIDGNLVKLRGKPLTSDIATKLIYPLISEEHMEKFQTEHNIDFSYRYNNILFRINVFQDSEGMCAAIRALSMDIIPIDQIGFPNKVWQDIINLTQGLVLVTGITGAGKSTTIASLLDRIIETRACRIITIEDPIEYIYKQRYTITSQREVGKDVKSFYDGLRAILREDPDVIFVGEMRDAETVAMTLMAAETGHLVFSTLHTRDATGTITRILDYFPPGRQNEVRNQLSLGLSCIICQKLIPKKDKIGRIVAMEILNNNYACANLIRFGKVEQLYSQMQTSTRNRPDENMITAESHLARLVNENEIDAIEAQKWANDLNCLLELIERDQLEK